MSRAEPPVLSFTVSRRLDAPPEVVFDTLTDLDGLPSWLPALVGLEPLTEGPYGVGTAWLESRRVFGRVVTEHVTVAGMDRPSHLVFRVDGALGTSRRGVYDFTWTLTSADGGTMLTLQGDGRGLGRVGRMVARFLVGPFRRACEADVAALAARVAGTPPAPSAPSREGVDYG